MNSQDRTGQCNLGLVVPGFQETSRPKAEEGVEGVDEIGAHEKGIPAVSETLPRRLDVGCPPLLRSQSLVTRNYINFIKHVSYKNGPLPLSKVPLPTQMVHLPSFILCTRGSTRQSHRLRQPVQVALDLVWPGCQPEPVPLVLFLLGVAGGDLTLEFWADC